VRPEWVDRRMMEGWLFAALGDERASIEARVADMVRDAPDAAPELPPVETLAVIEARLRALEARDAPVAAAVDLPQAAVTVEEEASPPVQPDPSAAGDDVQAQEPKPGIAPTPEPPPRSGFVLQTRMAELSLLVDQIAQDKIAERYPPGRIAEIDAIMLDVGRKTADGEMLTEAELAAERDWNAYSAYREAVMDHAQGLKGALLIATADQLEEIAVGLQEGWPDGSAD